MKTMLNDVLRHGQLIWNRLILPFLEICLDSLGDSMNCSKCEIAKFSPFNIKVIDGLQAGVPIKESFHVSLQLDIMSFSGHPAY